MARGSESMNLIQKFYKKKAKFDLWHSKQKEKALMEILEMYLTERVMAGDYTKKNVLIDTQNRVEEAKRLLKFLKETKI